MINILKGRNLFWTVFTSPMPLDITAVVTSSRSKVSFSGGTATS